MTLRTHEDHSDKKWMKLFVSDGIIVYWTWGAGPDNQPAQVLTLFLCDTANTCLDIAFTYEPLVNDFGE